MSRSLTQQNGALLSLACLVLACGSQACAEGGVRDPSPSVDLALKQSQLADKYRGLETKILKIAEYDASTNPRRSALLKQTLAKGKDRQIAPQLDDLVRLLREEQLQKAVDNQGAVCADLYVLLNLLLSENRPDRLKSEQARVRNYIKQLDRIIRQQKSVLGRTEGGELETRLAKDQEQVADRTGKLGHEMDQAEGTSKPGSPPGDQDASSSDGSSGDASDPSEPPSDGSSGDADDPPQSEHDPSSGDEAQEGNNGEKDNSTEKSDEPAGSESTDGQDGTPPSSPEQRGSAGESQPGPSQESPSSPSPPGQSGQPQQGSPSQSQPGPSQSGQPSPQQEQQFPGRKRIAAAEDRMRQAREQLEQAQREEAIEQQEEAQQLLEQAKAELEEILRQLREEEIERVLAMLEGRFRRMLEMELRVQAETVRLSKTPVTKRTRQFSIKVGTLRLDQRKIVLEVDKALTLLREEGSSVAFPEAVVQLRADMESVADLLAEEKVGAITQTTEADIISALEEMIAALQKAQQDAEQRRNQPPPPQGGMVDPSDQPLVDSIAELKMIRALQMRVNMRTVRFANMLADVDDPVGQATDDDLVQALQDLSTRQQRIHKVTSDIVLGKNK